MLGLACFLDAVLDPVSAPAKLPDTCVVLGDAKCQNLRKSYPLAPVSLQQGK
jgi:hypothetical protein